MWGPVLHTLAFLICLNVQTISSPLAGAWLLFHLGGCAALLYNRPYPLKKSAVWWATLAWAVALTSSAFIIMPVANGAVFMWILLATPSLALCLHKEDLPAYLKCFGTVITVYAVGLIVQQLLHVTYTVYNLGDYARAWPLLDPNNAAAVLNLALVPGIYMSLTRRYLFWPVWSVLLAAALYVTGSKAGMGAALICTLLMLVYQYRWRALIMEAAAGVVASAGVFYLRPDFIVTLFNSLQDRIPIWYTSWLLSTVQPWQGLGISMFGTYYQQIRTEHYTGGFFAHNDLLQLACEVGYPVMLVFVALIITIALKTTRTTMPAALAAFAVFLQAMFEFQFYVPAVSLPLGLAVGYHIANKKP